MHKPNRTTDEKSLSDRLRREALDARPEFSEALHERICLAVRECGEPEKVTGTFCLKGPEGASHKRCLSPFPGPAQLRTAVPRWALRWAMAVTAACLLAGLAIVWQASRPGPMPDVVDANPPAPAGADLTADLSGVSGLTDRVAARIPALVDSTFAIQQWAYLDHDARLGAELLTKRLPLEVGPLLAEESRQ